MLLFFKLLNLFLKSTLLKIMEFGMHPSKKLEELKNSLKEEEPIFKLPEINSRYTTPESASQFSFQHSSPLFNDKNIKHNPTKNSINFSLSNLQY